MTCFEPDNFLSAGLDLGPLKEVSLDEFIFANTTDKSSSLYAVACILSFVQTNWTGPPQPSLDTISPSDNIPKLADYGESIYALVKHGWLLATAEDILSKASAEAAWWYLRALFLHSRLLDNISEGLVIKIEGLLSANVDRLAKIVGGEIYIEAALIYQHCNNQARAETMLQLASKLCGFKHHLTGILGRRTKFQDFDVAQLTVEHETEDKTATRSTIETKTSPTLIELQDEYLLDKPALNCESASPLSVVGKAILLAECMMIMCFHAKETAATDRLGALIGKVLDNPGEWSLYSSALFLRSRLESSKARFVERAALQLQALVDQIKTIEVGFGPRIAQFFLSPLPPDWELDQCQAKLFAGLGAFRTAANIFERRQMWDEYVACLIQLGERSQAEGLLTSLLASNPANYKMLCVMGDLKEDITYYHKAWEVSGKRCARAMRSLGMYFVRNNQLQEAIEAFEAALALNGLYEKVWFLLGCTAMQTEDWNKALNAFTRTVSLEPDNGDAWNNLAAAHLRLGQEEEALKCLKEAAKKQFDCWRVWENIVRVAMSLGEISEAIEAYRRICEIRGKETPLQHLHMILETLRAAVEAHGLDEPSVRSVNRRTRALLDKVMATHLSTNYEFWYACATFTEIINEPLDTYEFYLKAYRSMGLNHLESDPQLLPIVLGLVRRLHSSVKRLLEGDSVADKSKILPTVKSIFRHVLERMETNHRAAPEYSQINELYRTI